MTIKFWGSAVCMAAAAFSFAAQPFADEADYLRRKWREDVADPTTGVSYPVAKEQLAKLMPQWEKEGSWTETKTKMFAWLCDHVAIDVADYDWFPTFTHWSRECVYHRYDNANLHPPMDFIRARDRKVTAAHLKGLRTSYPGSWFMYHDFDHSAPDWDDVLAIGFPGMKARLKANWKDDEFHRTRLAAVEGVLRLLDRLIAQAEKKVERVEKVERVGKVLASLRRLRRGAPVTTLDALNLIYLYWCISEEFEGIQVRTLGNLDRLITPFYRADLAAGRTNETEFREQLRHFWWQWGSIDNYWGQPLYFGGTRADGSTEYTEVSKIMLDVHDELALPTPKLHLKMGKSTPDWVWDKSLDMARRQRAVTFIGEEPHWRGIKSFGYDGDRVREFMLWGCYEWAMKDGANDTCGAILSLLNPVETLLQDAAKGTLQAPTFADFQAAYNARIAATVTLCRNSVYTNEMCLAEVNPSLMFSAASPNSVKTGKDAFAGGLAYGNNTGIWLIGVGTTTDALLAVKEIVYERQEMSLADLGKLMADNWQGQENLRRRMLRSKRKWGNNDAEANALAADIVKAASAPLKGQRNSRGGIFKASGHSARNHYGFGSRTGATPDGRRKGEEFSKNISPTMGADTEGVTALLASVAHLDPCDLPGDFPLDVALLPYAVKGEKGLAALRTLVESYFANNGLVIQFNILDAAVLRDAQKHPEKYENLQVRICGWNVRWNDIPPHEQEKFILRQESIQ